MRKAESFGKKKNCRYVILETFDWQGEGFYEKLGYEKVFSHKDFETIIFLIFTKKIKVEVS